MCFRVTKTSGRGASPGPPLPHSARHKEAARHGPSPEVRAEPGRRGCRPRPQRPVLARRCRTARWPAGRRTGSPPSGSGARHPSGTPPPGTVRRMFFAPPRRRRSSGVRGGTAPRQPPQGTPRSVATGSMLAEPPNSGSSQPCGRPRNAPQRRPEGLAPDPSQASSSASWPPASLKVRATGTTRSSATAARSPASALLYPSETRVRRSWAILRPEYNPKCPPTPAETASKPRGQAAARPNQAPVPASRRRRGRGVGRTVALSAFDFLVFVPNPTATVAPVLRTQAL